MFDVSAVLFLVSIPRVLGLSLRRAPRRTRTSQRDSTLEIGPERVLCQGAHSRSELEWSEIQRYSENDWGSLLYLAPGKILRLPKRVMNADQVEELQALPKERIGMTAQEQPR